MNNTFYSEFDFEPLGRGQGRKEKGRTPFELDRDRIIYSAAFRRLQSKTQVFMPGEYDFYRTRLTHSIEVAQIGRSICRHLNRTSKALAPGFHIDADLVEAACLAHDMGHPPFGHAGEVELNAVMRSSGGFEGNAQTLRLVADIFYRGPDLRPLGMNPTRAFADAVLKYKELFNPAAPQDRHFLYADQSDVLRFTLDDDHPASVFGPTPPNDFRSLECQIMDAADDIAYSVADLSDAIKARFITPDRIMAWADRNANALTPADLADLDALAKAIADHAIDAFLNARIGAFIHACSLVERHNPLTTKTNRYRFGLAMDPDMLARCKLAKKLARNLVFETPQILQLELKGSKIVRKLFHTFSDCHLKHTPPVPILPDAYARSLNEAPDQNAKLRVICDYLAGMTDGFATRTLKRLYDPDFGSFADLV